MLPRIISKLCLMNTVKTPLIIAIFFGMYSCTVVESEVDVNIQITYINETVDVVQLQNCHFDLVADFEANPAGAVTDLMVSIEPQSTVVLNFVMKNYSLPSDEALTEDNIAIFGAADCRAQFSNGSDPVCYGGVQLEGLDDITNYENRRKINDNSFEFTFRFDENIKSQAVGCG